MTTGSPPARAVSGPGVAETNAIRFESGDHAMERPSKVSGLLVLDISARKRRPLPSGPETVRPFLPPTAPLNATRRPSGDHSGADAGSLPPRRTVRPSATVITKSWRWGRPGWSWLTTVYATRAASGESRT